MKTWIYALALVLTANLAAEAQNTWTNDPGYSTHNYKHPNKAAAAKNKPKKITTQLLWLLEKQTEITKKLLMKL
jgi:hypothetical protein